MAFVTSYERRTPGGLRTRVLCCYDGRQARPDDPVLSHTVHFCQDPSGRLAHVEELWKEQGWGKRGKDLPICPGHRQPTDTDWTD